MKNKIFVEDLEQIHNQIDKVKFKNTTILITGCAGFLGFYILNYLTRYFEELNFIKNTKKKSKFKKDFHDLSNFINK